MVQKAKIRFLSFLSIFVGFFTTYLITPVKNKFHSGEGSGSLEFKMIRLARPQATAQAAGPQPTRTTDGRGVNNIASTVYMGTVQNLKLLRANGQSATLQRSVDVSAFESWLSSKGVQAQELSPDGLDTAYTEFRLDQISNQLDRIERLLK